MRSTGFHRLLFGAWLLALALAAGAAERSYRFDIPAQPLAGALAAFGKATGLQLIYPAELAANRRSPGVGGELEAAQALTALLQGTGLRFRFVDAANVRLEPAPAGDTVQLGPVRVQADTGSGHAPPQAQIGTLPEAYAGGQVARGAQLGLLGNRDLLDTPFSVTAYTSQFIQDRQAKSLADALINDASIRTDWSSRGGYSDSFTLRGFNLAAGDVAFDGLFGVAPRTFMPLESVERIEVLRGPSTMLSGLSPGGSIGGLINLVPKRAGAQALTRFTASYESDGYFAGHIDAGRRFGADQAFGARINAVYGDGDTATDNQSAEVRNVSAAFDYRGERARVTLDLGYLKRITDAPMRPASITAAAVPDAPDAGDNFAQRWGYVELSSFHGALRTEFDLNDALMVYAAAGFRRNPTDLLVSVPAITNANGDFTERNLLFFDDVNSKTGEVGLRAEFTTGGIGHSLAVTASALEQERFNITHTVATVSSNLYRPNRIPKPNLAGYSTHPPLLNEQRLMGLAIADTLSLFNDRAQLTLGLRRQWVEADNYSATSPYQRTNRYDEGATTPAVALVVRMRDDVSLYANYSEGLSPGVVVPAGNRNAGESLSPYVSRQIEAGVKFDFGRFGATAGVFQIKQPSTLATPVAGGLPVLGVDGQQRNRGFEVNGFGELADGLRLLGGAMYLDAEQTRTLNGVNDGNTAIGAPKRQLNLGLEWDAPFAPRLTFNGTVVYTDDQYVNAANTLRIPDWTRLDIGAAYRIETPRTPILLRAQITNVLNEDYWAAASVFGGQLSTGAPRTLAVSATFDF